MSKKAEPKGMRHWVGTRIVILGHLISCVGCRLRGAHANNPGYERYCLLCGRLVR